MGRMIQVCMVVFLLCMVVGVGNAAQNETFSTEKMITDLNKKIELSKEQWEELQPFLDQKSEELKKSVDEYVDKGFVQMDELSQKLKEVSEDTEKKVTAYLNSEEMQKLKSYLEQLDEDALKEAKDRLIAELSEVLELTEAQLDSLKPVIEDSMVQISGIISDLARKGSSGWEDFKEQYKKLTETLKKQLEETLNEQQMDKFEKYKKDQQEKIQMALAA